MILETKNKNIEQYSDSLGKGTFKVKAEDMALMFETIRSGMYSNAIGSICREISSNCIDATIERDLNTDPDLVKWLSNVSTFDIEYTNKNVITGSFESIIFRDYGIGLSPERVEETYKCLFNSPKRTNNKFIGAYGIGSKSPFAYTEEFYIQTRYCGIEYLYLVFIDETNLGSIDLIQSKSTEECNGTEIIIPVKNRYDKATFEKEIELQLAYIENKTIKGLNVKTSKIVFEDDLLIRSSIERFNKPHLHIGGIAYPLDISQITGIDWFDRHNTYDIALKIGVGQVDLTPSRESLRYTAKTKDYINGLLVKINERKDELQSIEAPKFDHYLDYVKYYHKIITEDGGSSSLTTQSSLYFYRKFTNSSFVPAPFELEYEKDIYILKYNDWKNYLSVNFKIEQISRGATYVNYYTTDFSNFNIEKSNNKVYFKSDKYLYKKNLYLIETSSNNKFYTVYPKDKLAPEANNGSITQNANELHEYFLSYLMDNLEHYEDVVVDESKITKTLEDDTLGMSAAKLRKLNSKIFYKQADSEYSRTLRCQEVEFKQVENKLSWVDDSKSTINYIFGFKEDDLSLKAAFHIIDCMSLNSSYKVIKIAKEVEEHFQDCIYVKEFFMENENNLIADWYTGYKVKDEIDQYEWLSTFKGINKDLYDKYKRLDELKDHSYSFINKIHNDFKTSLIEHLEKTKCYNQSDIDSLKEIEDYSKDLGIFKYLNIRNITDESTEYRQSVVKILELLGKKFDVELPIVVVEVKEEETELVTI